MAVESTSMDSVTYETSPSTPPPPSKQIRAATRKLHARSNSLATGALLPLAITSPAVYWALLREFYFVYRAFESEWAALLGLVDSTSQSGKPEAGEHDGNDEEFVYVRKAQASGSMSGSNLADSRASSNDVEKDAVIRLLNEAYEPAMCRTIPAEDDLLWHYTHYKIGFSFLQDLKETDGGKRTIENPPAAICRKTCLTDCGNCPGRQCLSSTRWVCLYQ